MLKKLSERNQKEIALGFIALFFVSGLNSLKAEMLGNRNFIYSDKSSYKSVIAHRSKKMPLNNIAGKKNNYANLVIDNNENKIFKEVSSGTAATLNSINKTNQEESSQPLIGGPSQPEMQAFKSVGSDNMVSPFTGDFSYNIPLLDVGGYPINMFYNSGITMDQEASWVGLGWNLNPGTITRNMRGLPDDFDGTDIVTKRQNFKADKTWGVTTGADIKISGIPSIGLGAGLSGGVSYNNKLGIATEGGLHTSISIGAKAGDNKTVNLSLSVGLNASSRSGASISPSVSLSMQNEAAASGGLGGSIGVGYTYSSRMGLSSMHVDANHNIGVINLGQNSTLSFAYPSVMPSISKRFTKNSISLNTSVGAEYFWVNPTLKLGGYYTATYLDPDDTVSYHPAYGMLNYQKANYDPNALLDFNRANDGMYTPSSPAIAMPVYTYDVFNISGEGTGGSFRAYRGDIGHMRDASVTTKEKQGAKGFDVGFGNIMHGGSTMSYVFTPTTVGDWSSSNVTGNTFSFQDNSGLIQASYFKNPGEKTVPDAAFQNSIGNEDLVRLKLGNTGSPTPLLLPNLIRYDAGKNVIGEIPVSENTRKAGRDKRTQVISFLTAEESERIGMNTKLYSYRSGADGYEDKVIFSGNCSRYGLDSLYRNQEAEHAPVSPEILGGETNVFRKKNHISEIDVLGGDGRKYVYGLPVYNKRQVEVTFSINHNDRVNDAKAQYETGDNTGNNIKGRDWIMDQQEMPAYTHSFLLTELLSPNYVDVTANGLTEDDMGDGIKFNYSKFKDFKWRTPIGEKSASYNEGLKTDDKDDKAHYIYGEREQWYLYSVESKNMVARFYVKNDRKDGRAVLNEDGKLDNDNGMQRLDKISLFSKADLNKPGTTPRPIKTIRFFQSYKLTPGVDNNGGNGIDITGATVSDDNPKNINKNKGKLTLDSIWITYNGNHRKPKSRYVFYYPDDAVNNNNPGYTFDNTDRWGTYKPVTDNSTINANSSTPISNEDYPYSVQEKLKADKNAAAWTMNKILLPSGAVINIDYESDTYAYVQDRKAMSMCSVLGFGTILNETALPAPDDLNKLYTDGGENDHVYIKLPYSVNNTVSYTEQVKEFAARYLKDVRQLYLKLAVDMPYGNGLSGIKGTENIGVYADVDWNDPANYGLISPDIAWIKIAPMYTGHSPMVQGVLQFLTQQLPGKAYKGYDVNDVDEGTAIVSALSGMIGSVKGLCNGEFNVLIGDKKCQTINTNQSFVKLTNPVRNKFGGGLRVRKVVINDNWTKMTKQLESTYGQEYHYTTTEQINGKLETISSGVAAWEPSIGGDESPFREIQRFVDHNKGGPYDFGAIEMPLGEMFYPGAMVGYSRVEVVSIHRDTVKNSPTRQVTEFYTNKDFPYKSSSTNLTADAHCKYEAPHLMQLLKIDLKKNVTLSQGFMVETNDMNGKEKSHATYTESDPLNPVSYTQNFYNTKQATDKTYGFNHIFPAIIKSDGVVANSLIGRDIELMTDFREHTTETIAVNVDMNFDLALWGEIPIPVGMVLAPVTKESTLYRSASVLKIVTHYGMLDSVVVVDKGSMVSTKNLVYDAETGNPLLTRTQNEHNKPLYNFSYPAHWAYSGMGPAYKNIDAKYTNLNFAHGILTNPPAGFFDNVLESGDEIYAIQINNNKLPEVLPCEADANTNTPWTTLDKNEANRIWAVNTAKAGAANPVWVFMDASGHPYNAAQNMIVVPGTNQVVFVGGADIRIVRSGKRNMLDQSVGSVTSLKDPIDHTTNKLVFNTNTNIIQTSAATFKDHWRVDNAFYKALRDLEVVQARVHRLDDKTPDSFVTVKHERAWRGDLGFTPYFYLPLAVQGDALSLYNRYFYQDLSGGESFFYSNRMQGYLLYSYNDLPANAHTYKALLSLYSHTDHLSPSALANHPYMHAPSSSQNNPYLLGEIHALSGNWLNTAEPEPWILNYFTTVQNGPSNVSIGRGIIPYAPNGWESFINGNIDTRVNVTLPLISNTGTPLALRHKLGLRLRLMNDEHVVNPSDRNDVIDYRCFWSPTASTACSLKYENFNGDFSTSSSNPRPCVSPKLSYYYYICGDTSLQFDYPNDPFVNTIVTCTTNTIDGLCHSKFKELKSVNPYVEGIFGNWRVDSTYAYYGKRKESDFTSGLTVDTRTGGAINNYKTFWQLSNSSPLATYLTRNLSANDVWVWNSTITQYNRKGYEIENTDPLGRFNSGLYGYNQQLPIAVANNSRVREIMFDGFEDYDYRTDANCESCKPHRHFNYIDPIAGRIVETQKHTGRNSLRVDAGESVKIQAPITDTTEANRAYSFRINSSITKTTNLRLATTGTPGTGLMVNYYNHIASPFTTPVLEPRSHGSTWIFGGVEPTVGPILHNELSIAPGVSPDYFSVQWKGRIQAPVTGTYKFQVLADNGVRIKINGRQITSTGSWNDGLNPHYEISEGVPMWVGSTYEIEISFYNTWGPSEFVCNWNYAGGVLFENGEFFAPIPTAHLYSGNGPFMNTITTEVTCNRLDSSQAYGNALTDSFSLLQSKKMLLSAWVKAGEANCCFPATYDNGTNSISITYPGNTAPVPAPFKPAGSIIEGWQRYESVFEVPVNASSITISLNNDQNGNAPPVFFDDIRIHPFNANLKSFVYHSSNLRLMAELDENNYASFYEYDDDGTLTRVKKETQRGIKTITETRSATQKNIKL